MKPVFWTALALMTAPVSALAEQVCMSSSEMEASLVDWYGEKPVDGSETEKAQMWASDETGTWTLVSYLVDGNSCVIAQGNDWTPEQSDDLLFAALEE